MSKSALDAQALLNREPGLGPVVDALAQGAMTSTVSFPEALARLVDTGLSGCESLEAIEPLEIDYAPSISRRPRQGI